ncbi:MAG: fused MFS/spermidine synthase [Phycisphaerales bacterium]
MGHGAAGSIRRSRRPFLSLAMDGMARAVSLTSRRFRWIEMSHDDFYSDASLVTDPPSIPRDSGLIVPLYCAALFLGSLLLFLIEPMFTKMILPLMGGTPAVWNTAMMFFQAMLLIGYLYAHLLSRLKTLRGQALIHTAVLAAGFLFLPAHAMWQETVATSTHPIPWLIGLLAVSIGMPFFAVSATAPLLQRWFSRSDHPHADDPYFLYASSNAGGLIALLAYPVLIEPWFGLKRQSHAWAAGYLLLTAIILLCSVSLWAARRRRRGTAMADLLSAIREQDIFDPSRDQIRWSRRAQWVALAFVPSALLLAATQHISTDVAAVPLLWVVPLTLYLLSFVIVFARRPILRHRWMLWLQVWVYALLAIYFKEDDYLWLTLALNLLAFFVTAMVCHGELVRRRPAAEHLTEFYLWMSVGGLLGGVFCSLIAPVVFDSVLEYPLVLILACLVRPTSGRGTLNRRLLDLALPTIVIALYILTSERLDVSRIGRAGPILFYGATAVALYSFRKRPLRLTLGFAGILVYGIFLDKLPYQFHHERSFFGVYTVCTNKKGNEHRLYNSTTLHGEQCMDPEDLCIPRTYYTREGPLGQICKAMNDAHMLRRIGVIGLGTGTAACYHTPGQSMTFFEVDPVMERIARDPKLFRYLELCAQQAKVVIGDGRQSLLHEPDGAFELLVLDAFTSDAIPVHMLTREALALYIRKLAPGGIAMLHISNRYLNLEPVVANLVEDAGLAGLIQEHDPSDSESLAGASASTWVAVARDPADLGLLDSYDGWYSLRGDPAVGVWTDDYSNVFRILSW